MPAILKMIKINELKNKILTPLAKLKARYFDSLEVKKQQAAIIGFSVVVVLFFLLVFLRPAVSGLFNTSRELGKLKSTISNLKTELANFGAISNNLETEKNSLDGLTSRLATEGEIVPLLDQLSEIANLSYLKIISISPQREIFENNKKTLGPDDVFTEFPISIVAQCEYHQLGIFINRLELSERMLQVDDISIIEDKRNPTKHKVNLVVKSAVRVK